MTGTGDGLSFNVDSQADLQPSISAPTGDQIAGDPAGFDYAVSVTNNGPSDNTGGYTVTGTLPSGVSFASGRGLCVEARPGRTFTCSDTEPADGCDQDLHGARDGGVVDVAGFAQCARRVASTGDQRSRTPRTTVRTPIRDSVSIITQADLRRRSRRRAVIRSPVIRRASLLCGVGDEQRPVRQHGRLHGDR